VAKNNTTFRLKDVKELTYAAFGKITKDVWTKAEEHVVKIEKEYCKENCIDRSVIDTGTCFIQKIYVPSSSLLQGKHLPFSPSPLRLNIFRLFVILSLSQLDRYTPKIFLFTTATFEYTYSDELDKTISERCLFYF
jgi:hypothetical protein